MQARKRRRATGYLRHATREPGLQRVAALAAALSAGAAAVRLGKQRGPFVLDGRHPDRRFELSPSAALDAELVRVAEGQLQDIFDHLAHHRGAVTEKAVHESRKSIKRLRAMTRLLRDELGPEAYVLENGTLRDAAARLAGARDAEVLLKTLDSIRAKFPAGAQPDGVRALRAQLLDQRARASERLLSDAQAVQGALYDLYSVQVRVPGWVGQQADFDVLAPGLHRIYRQGRDRYRLARADPSIEHLHDWRKRVKDLRHAAELLAPANRAGIGSLARRADKLGELLGEDHDLAVLGEVVACRRELFATPRDSERLQRLIEVRRERVQERALKAGAKLYRRGPSKFLGRLERDWRRAG